MNEDEERLRPQVFQEAPPHPLLDTFRSLDLRDDGNVGVILYNNPDFIEDEDLHLIKNIYHDVIRNAFLGTTLGIAANIQLKRIPNFLTWNRFLRFGLRIPAFFLPFYLVKNNTRDKLLDLLSLVDKYQRRFLDYQETGKFHYIDPDGKLEKRYKQQLS